MNTPSDFDASLPDDEQSAAGAYGVPVEAFAASDHPLLDAAPPTFGRRVTHALGLALRDLVEAVVLAAVLWFVLQFALQSTIVEGTSMEPNFFSGEWVMVNKLAYRVGAPKRGDVIVFHAPDAVDKDYIKRVIGLPGETVQVRSGTVYVDGEAIDEPWLPRVDTTAFGPYPIPDGDLFVMGDNRPASSDSRLWPVAGLGEDRIVGKVWLSVWPRRAWGIVPSDAPPAGRRD
ncbi:MAG: signal peptidase I [Ardenticatenales bacterium]